MTRLKRGDSVEIIANTGMWAGEVGMVTKVIGPNIYVKTPAMREAHPFTRWELRLSQQKLIEEPQTEE